MDRETRKANLKKLQLPGTSDGGTRQQRKTRKNSKTTTEISTKISKYFSTPEKLQKSPIKDVDNPSNENNLETINHCATHDTEKAKLLTKPSHLKRTKLDTFVFKDPNNIPNAIKDKPLNDDEDDLVVPEKKVKKAPKLPSTSGTQTKRGKSSKTKKQTTIKSAFLRNEQIFAEIAAQHCAADQFDGDDVQIALAISRSEAEAKGIHNDAQNEYENVVDLVDSKKNPELLIEKLKEYGFRTAEKKDYNTFAAAFLPKANGRRTKSKWANKFTPLTLRNPETQKKKLQDNIKSLLNKQYRFRELAYDEELQKSYKLQSSLLQKCDMENKEILIYKLENTSSTTNDQYFVIELFEINNLPAGHLLKDWSAIQGRDLSPTTKSQQSREKSILLENIYRELEEFFRSSKRLEFTITNETKEEDGELQVIMPVTDDNTGMEKENLTNNLHAATPIEEGKNELDEMIALIEELNENECSDMNSSCEKLNDILPPIKSLDMMNVSVYSKHEELNENECSLTNSSCANLKNILPPIKSLDMMHVSLDYKTEELKENEYSVKNSSLEKLKNVLPTVKSLDVMNISIDQKPIDDENEYSEVQKNNNTSIDTNCNDKIKFILPPIKSLDTMLVSTCNKETEATFNVLQNTRSNSPDLFADSDNEMEQESNDTESKDVNASEVIKGKSSLMDMNGVTSYEIYSSDEVKNTSSTEHNNPSARQEIQIHEQSNNVIDLTQDDFNTSKALVEIDLFAESPLQEDHDIEIDFNSNSQQSKYLKDTKEDTSNFTLSLQSISNDQEIVKEQIKESLDDTIKLIHKSMATKLSDILEDNGHDDEDLVLREMAMDQTNSSFFSFKGTKQLETCFHKETNVRETKILRDSFTANDSIFRDLSYKHLEENISECYKPSVNKTDNYLSRSFTQPTVKIKTPKKLENITDIFLDFIMPMENVTASRKSNSFNTKTPKKSKNCNDFQLSKTQSFNDDKSDISIDLTQNEDDNGTLEEDDDCLILSDDEINYSIWQADKTEKFKNSNLTDEDNSLNNEEENQDLTEEVVVDFPIQKQPDFDYMNLMENQSSSFKTKEYCSNLEMLTISKSEEFNFNRSDFGILEERSDSPDYTSTLSTPTKHLNNVSFLNSPTEKTEPMKRYSNYQKSSQKFNDLLKSLDKKSSPSSSIHNDFEDFDEFDHLINENSFTKTNSFKEPEGLELLLTSEIYLNKSQKSPLSKTPIKSTIESFSSKQEYNYNNKTYTIRCITSPKPDYTQYSESELLKELYNFGIKPLKRKQAVKILEYIYNQTHPTLLEDDDDVNEKQQMYDDVPSTSKSCIKSWRKTTSVTEQNSSFTLSNTVEKTFESSSSLATQNVMKTKETIKSFPSSQSNAKEVNEEVNNKLCLKDACGMDMLRYSIDLKAELLDENYILQTNVTKKTPQPLLPFHIAWYNLVCSNRKLHETILMYEPIDLQQIYLFLKGLGYRYDPKDLKIFFDRRCIIFRYDLAAAGSNGKTINNNRHIRKSKKQKTQKNKLY